MSELLPVETELWERDMNFAYDKGRTDGAREFAEWLGIKEEHVDEVLAEWQKGKENEP